MGTATASEPRISKSNERALQNFMKYVAKRNQGEPEFLQAVQE